MSEQHTMTRAEREAWEELARAARKLLAVQRRALSAGTRKRTERRQRQGATDAR
jgi:hypothetical protein